MSKKADPRLDGLGTIVRDVNILPSSLFTHLVGLWVCGKRETVFSTYLTELHDSDKLEGEKHVSSELVNHPARGDDTIMACA